MQKDTDKDRGLSRRRPQEGLKGWKGRPLKVWALAIMACLLLYPRAKALVWPDRVLDAQGNAVLRMTHDINVLLMGVDERGGDKGRSDTMILLNYDALSGRLHLLSVPRDTRVRLPKYGYQKINAAYPLGGRDLVKQAVSELTGLHVDYYLKVNFDGFSKVVDALNAWILTCLS